MKTNVPSLSYLLYYLFLCKEKAQTKNKAESIKFETGLHVPGGCPGVYPKQEAPISTLKAVSLLIILELYLLVS